MSTFKAALRVAAAHPLYIIIYTVVVSLMGAFIAQMVGAVPGTSAGEVYEPYAASVAVVDRDGSALSRSFARYLGERYELADVADDADEQQDAVATGRADCIFFIPKGFGADLLAAARSGSEFPQAEEAYGVSTQASALVGSDAAHWVSLAGSAAALEPQADAERVIELTETSADAAADVRIHATAGKSSAADQLSVFLRFESYAITSSVIVCVGLVLSALSEPDVRRRLEAGPQTPRSRAGGMLVSCLVLTLGVCVVSAAVGLIALHDAVASLVAWQVVLAFCANLVFGLVPLAIAFLCSGLGAREEVLNACGNILGMVMSFMGGAWVPLSFMGATVVTAAHFFPTFWTNDAIVAVLSASAPTGSVLATYLTDVGITALFAIAIAAVALALSRNRQR